MRNIWRVFCTDLRSLSRSFFACAVVVGIVLLPSLYAWLNIYSNWDPYGNTGGISIAVASLDKGYDDDGTYVNKGQDVVDDLRDGPGTAVPSPPPPGRPPSGRRPAGCSAP